MQPNPGTIADERLLYVAGIPNDGGLTEVHHVLREGANINFACCPAGGCTPLLAAVQGNCAQVARVLLSRGARIDLAMMDGTTPLHIASENGHYQVVLLLLAKGASVNLCTHTGWTPLLAAAGKGRVGVVRLLLQHGADAALAPLHAEDSIRQQLSKAQAFLQPLLDEVWASLTFTLLFSVALLIFRCASPANECSMRRSTRLPPNSSLFDLL